MHSEAGLLRWKLDTVDELDARPRIVCEEEVAVEVDVVAEARHLHGGRDPETRLDHAAEHHSQAERPCRIRHADSLAQPAALGELEVDAVCSLGCGTDVTERVDGLVR